MWNELLLADGGGGGFVNSESQLYSVSSSVLIVHRSDSRLIGTNQRIELCVNFVVTFLTNFQPKPANFDCFEIDVSKYREK